MSQLTLTGELQEKTLQVKSLETKAKSSLFGIAWIIKEINDKSLYKLNGFESIVSYSEKVLNYKKAFTYNLIKIADVFMKDGKSIFGDNYSIGQVQELLYLPKTRAEKLVKDGVINAVMTTKEIREIVKKEKEKLSGAEQETPKEKSSQQDKDTAKKTEQETPKETKENKRIKKLVKLFYTMEQDLNSLSVEPKETERRMRLLNTLQELKNEIGLK